MLLPFSWFCDGGQGQGSATAQRCGELVEDGRVGRQAGERQALADRAESGFLVGG